MTMADKIRHMTDEQMMEFFRGNCALCIFGDDTTPCGNCKLGVRDYLRQEVEE